MKSVLLLSLSCLFIITFRAECQRTIPAVPPEAEVFFQRALAEIKAGHITWIKRTAAAANSQDLDEAEIRRMTSSYARGNNLGQMEVESLITMIMMLLANDTEKDLKQMMNALNELKKEKEKILQAIGELEKNKTNITRIKFDSLRLIAAQKITLGTPTQPAIVRTNNIAKRLNEDSLKRTNIAVTRPSAAEIKQVQDELKTQMDSMNGLSEMSSIRLQMTMDRRSKIISTLSNIMKKISKTQDSIIQNLK